MKAIKGNREYTITEETKQQYINDGFDIYNDKMEKIAEGKGKAISQKEYNKLLTELEEARKTTLSDSEIIPVLKEYARLKEIEIGQASTAKGIYAKVKDSIQEGEE